MSTINNVIEVYQNVQKHIELLGVTQEFEEKFKAMYHIIGTTMREELSIPHEEQFNPPVKKRLTPKAESKFKELKEWLKTWEIDVSHMNFNSAAVNPLKEQ